MKTKPRLVIYDTSNFVDFPLGGQLTSIQGFLRHLAEDRPDVADKTVLVGVTLDPAQVGVLSSIKLFGRSFDFLPVCLAETDQSHTKRSLRLEYAKGLLRHLGQLHLSEDDVNYIHTPEAFTFVGLCGGRRRYVFSHGSFIGMSKDLRFFAGSPVAGMFQRYMEHVIKAADGLFVLDHKTQADYSKLNGNVRLVGNSITYREDVKRCFDPKAVSLLFVGRFSAVKGIPAIIEAAEADPHVASLTLVGAGELNDELRSIPASKVRFAGALAHDAVLDEMRRADILVMNSSHEGIPMTILEAMGMGLPVVTTDVGGIPEVVEFGATGEKTDGCVNSIRKAIRRVALDYQSYSPKAYEASERYMYTAVNKAVIEALLPREVQG